MMLVVWLAPPFCFNSKIAFAVNHQLHFNSRVLNTTLHVQDKESSPEYICVIQCGQMHGGEN